LKVNQDNQLFLLASGSTVDGRGVLIGVLVGVLIGVLLAVEASLSGVILLHFARHSSLVSLLEKGFQPPFLVLL
jgi:hypothetical protein